MAECIVLKGGGGADLDVVTAGAPDILAGKVAVDKDGEPVTGTMANRGSAYHGVGSGLNTQGLYYYIGRGYYSEGSNNPWVYMTRAEVAATLGIEPWKMRGDVNLCGVQGGIPIQSADAGSDNAWSTSWGNWGDGNIFMGVRNGYFLNGVNWIRTYIENFWASNIKKGVNIGGVVGTFEGYVPGVTDLYYRGNNVIGFTNVRGINFDAGQITFPYSPDSGSVRANFSTVGKSYLNIQGYKSSAEYELRFQLYYNTTTKEYSGTKAGEVLLGRFTGEYTINFDVRALQIQSDFQLCFSNGFHGAVYRIWLS
jgi:hypothetical protein